MIPLNENSSFDEWSKLYLYNKRSDVSLGYYTEITNNIKHINIFFKDSPINEIKALDVDFF